MNDNKFNIRRLEKWRADSEELFRTLGMRQQQYADRIGSLADDGTQCVIAKASQFLFDFKECGADAMTERGAGCRATQYNDRTASLSILSKFATGN